MNFSAEDKKKLEAVAEDAAYVRGVMDSAILPALKTDIPELYEKAAANEKEIALVKQAHETCPAAKAYSSRWHRSSVWVAGGALLVSICALVVMIITLTTEYNKESETTQKPKQKMEKQHAPTQ